jgi:hypothetical protein
MKTLRNQLGDALSGALGKSWAVFPDPTTFRDTFTKPTLILERTKLEPLPEAPAAHGVWKDSLNLILVDNDTDNEDHLDELLEDVIEALDEVLGVRWLSAERGMYQLNPTYKITLSTTSTREQTT